MLGWLVVLIPLALVVVCSGCDLVMLVVDVVFRGLHVLNFIIVLVVLGGNQWVCSGSAVGVLGVNQRPTARLPMSVANRVKRLARPG